jgi:hypothetical protein
MPKGAGSGFDSHHLRHIHNHKVQESQRGSMRIRVIENHVVPSNVYENGNIKEVVEKHIPTGRSWDLDIPIEPVELKEVWIGIKGDIRELIRLAANSIRCR